MGINQSSERKKEQRDDCKRLSRTSRNESFTILYTYAYIKAEKP